MPTVTSVLKDESKLAELRSFIKDVRNRDIPESYLIAVLHKAQDLYGYIDKEVVAVISSDMGVSLSRIWGVCTFYHYFNLKPRGKYAISVCLGTACYVKGAPRVLQAIKDELGIAMGETTPDMLFTLMETRCLGACGLAPTMMINSRIYGELTPAKAVEVLKKLRAEASQK
jgi:NADH:ubiquinone oxidoreductase subunit E